MLVDVPIWRHFDALEPIAVAAISPSLELYSTVMDDCLLVLRYQYRASGIEVSRPSVRDTSVLFTYDTGMAWIENPLVYVALCLPTWLG